MGGRRVVVLGAGFGGLEAATRLSRELGTSSEIVLIDRRDSFVIGSSNIEILAGERSPHEVQMPYASISGAGIRFVQDTVHGIDPASSAVHTGATTWTYDYLVVALGAELSPDTPSGFSEFGHHFYAPDGSERLHEALVQFSSGRILMSIFGMPYRCPPAPFEGALSIDRLLRERGVRDKSELVVTVPGTEPLGLSSETSQLIRRRFEERDIRLRTETGIDELLPRDGASPAAAGEGATPGRARLHDGSELPFDLFVGVPVHRLPQVLRESPLGSGRPWIPVDRRSFATEFEKVFVIGDCAAISEGGVTIPKAGVFAEESARVVADRIVSSITGKPAQASFDGKGTCYFQLDAGRVAAMRANFFEYDKPVVELEGPSPELLDEKRAFVRERAHRWFGSGTETRNINLQEGRNGAGD